MDYLTYTSFGIGLVFGILITFFFRRRAGQVTVEAKAKKLLSTKQEAFIAIASHYLLTPISVIQSAITRLNEKPNMPLSERQELYNTIVSGEKRLYIIAEQMLLAVRLINGEFNLSPKVARLHDPVIEAIREVEPIAKQKRITFKNTIKQTPPIEASFDARQIKTAVVAVLDNAIKFSHEKSEVRVTVKSEGQNGIIQVDDDGIGMTEEQMERATEKFYRGTPPYVFDYEGMGLGLHVAFIIMNAHQGDIDLRSQGKNKGSSVSLILPIGR